MTQSTIGEGTHVNLFESIWLFEFDSNLISVWWTDENCRLGRPNQNCMLRTVKIVIAGLIPTPPFPPLHGSTASPTRPEVRGTRGSHVTGKQVGNRRFFLLIPFTPQRGGDSVRTGTRVKDEPSVPNGIPSPITVGANHEAGGCKRVAEESR